MAVMKHFDTLVVITPKDCQRLLKLYPRLVENIKYGKIIFVGSSEVASIVESEPSLRERVGTIDENDVIPFGEVHACVAKRLENILSGRELPRGVTGWYYQQFLKMQYSFICKDEFYMVWDGDTIPCHEISMFQEESGKPYIDLKHEYHKEYFDTLSVILPGFHKVIERSFISEHMLIRTDIMRELITEIERYDAIPGEKFWEKIINAIEPEKIQSSSFSEFETYGTYVAVRHPDVYKLREWHSFRQGGTFFSIDTICDRDFQWLSKDFQAISFEKGHDVRPDNANLFDNPEYQSKLTPKQMLQAAQKEYKDGYKEVWGDDIFLRTVNRSEGAFQETDEKGWKTSENAIKGLKDVYEVNLNNTGNMKNGVLIVVVSYNSIHLLQECIRSIRECLTEVKYKIVVTDNASTDGVREWLREQADILLIENDENVGFGPACNQAVNATINTEFKEYDVFLLNNDTRLTKRALENLMVALYSSEKVGAVGSVSNYAGNKQALDIEYDTVREYVSFGEQNNLEEAKYEERVRLSGFAMLVRRSVWEKAGGFDEDFAPGYFEDDALSMEIINQGYRMLLVRNSFVYHAGSQSFSKTDYNSLLISHHELFIKKYGFDILDYAYCDRAIVEQIPYGADDEFVLLEAGAGLGASLKSIRSRWPKAVLYGVETDCNVCKIAGHTEQIFSDFDEAARAMANKKANILVIGDTIQNELTQAEKEKLVALCWEDALLYVKTRKYDEFAYDKIKVVIWDMDETFWKGTISEGEVLVPYINVELVTCLTDHGIINSISSKNDEEPVMDELAADGIAGLFVFNNINWDEKGSQIKEKLKIMGLRAENALFIDDNPRNLEQAKFYSEKLMTADPDIIPYLLAYFKEKNPKDQGHTRLEQYKLLERKTEAKAQSDSDTQFLYDSDIRITINKNCIEELDRIHELVERSNQLNYTKNRDSKEVLNRLISNDWNDAAYIRAHDKFGDYGIIGFYLYNSREKKMEHFVFSCRILGMGIEQYVYNKLGCPDFDVVEPVSVKLEKEKTIDWIKEDAGSEYTSDNIADNRIRVLLKGPCDMSAIEPYLSGGSITTEFNFVNSRGFITTGQNHSMHIWESAHLSDDELAGLLCEVPFITAEDFETKIFSEEYHVICYSLLQDAAAGLYKKKDEDLYISFSSKNFDLTDSKFKDGFINGTIQNHAFPFTEEIINVFSEKWEFVGNTPIELLLRNLDYIYEHAPGHPTIVLLLGSEIEYEGYNEEFANLVDYYRTINPIIRDFADDHERVRAISVTDFIKSQADFMDCINHFSRDVYFNIAGELSKYINEKVIV